MIVLVFYIQLILIIYLGYLFLYNKKAEPTVSSDVILTSGKNIDVKRKGNTITIDSTLDTYDELKKIVQKSPDVDLKCDDAKRQILLELCAMEDRIENFFVAGDHIKLSKSSNRMIIDQLPLTDQEFKTHLEHSLISGSNIECVPHENGLQISVPTSKIVSQFVPGENIKFDKIDEDKIKISGILPIIDINGNVSKEQVFKMFKAGENINMELTSEGIVVSSPSSKIKNIISNYIRPGKSINVNTDSDYLYISSAISLDDLQQLFIAGDNIVLSKKDEKLVISNTISNAQIHDKIKDILVGGENILITPQDAKLVISNTQQDAKSQLEGWLVAGEHVAISPLDNHVLISVDKKEIYNTIKNMLTSSDDSLTIIPDDQDLTLDFGTSYALNDEILINKIVQFMTGSEDIKVSKTGDKINLNFEIPKLMSNVFNNLIAGDGISFQSLNNQIKISGNMSESSLVNTLEKCLVGQEGIAIKKVDDKIQIMGADSSQMLTKLQNLLSAGENVTLVVDDGKLKISSYQNVGEMLTSDSNIKIDVSKDVIKFNLNMDALDQRISFVLMDKFNEKIKNTFSSTYFTSALDPQKGILVGINPVPFNDLIQNYLTVNNIYPIRTTSGLTVSNMDNKISLGLDTHVLSTIIASYLDKNNITGIVAGAGVIANSANNTTTFSIDNQVITNLVQSYLNTNNIRSVSIGAGLSSSTSNNITTISLDLYNQLKTVLSRGNLVNVIFREKSKKIAFRYDLLSNDLNLGNTIDLLT